MIAELAISGVLTLSGLSILVSLRGDFRAALAWLALPIGAVVYLLAALVLLTLTGTLDPETALAITGATGAVGFVVSVLRRRWNAEILFWAVAIVAAASVTVVLARTIHLTRLTPDSLRYLLFAGDMQAPDALSEIHRADFLNRQMGLPSLHALSSLTDRRYLTSIGPLFGISGVGFFVWLCWSAAREMSTRHRLMLVLPAVLFLGSSNRLVYDSFYINTHIEVAVYMLIAVAGSWLAITTGEWRWAVPAGVALAATLVFRPESPIVVAIVLVAVGATNANWRVRLAMIAPMVAVAALWYGVILWQNAGGGNTISLRAPVFGSLVALAGAVLVVVAGGFRRLSWLIRYADRVMLGALLLALIALALANLDVFTSSLEAAFQNVALSQGAWLLTWSVALVLLVVALAVHEIPIAKLWITPILGFAITWLLLPMIREGAWRVGTGDSGNRILAHMLAVVVAFLVFAAIRSWPRALDNETGRSVQPEVPRGVS